MLADGQQTRAELVHLIDEKWAELHLAKTRFVNACSDKQKAHYLAAVNVSEQEHTVLWDMLVTGDFIPDDDDNITDEPF